MAVSETALTIPECSGGQQLAEIVRQQFSVFDERGEDEIYPARIAQQVYAVIQPHPGATVLTECAAVLSLTQITRDILRRRQAVAEHEAETQQRNLFGGIHLQPFYPTDREGKPYVRLKCLTVEEHYFNSSRLRAEGSAKIKHADALEARANWLVLQS